MAADATLSVEVRAEVEQFNKGMKSVGLTLEDLKHDLVAYKDIAANSLNPATVQKYSAKIKETEAEISRLTNAGKKGFDEMGNAVIKNSNGLTKAYSGLRTLANILPGVGIAGILAFATEPIIDYISSLDLLKTTLSATAEAQKDIAGKMGEVAQASAEAGIQVDILKQNFSLARQGVIDKAEVLKQYNEGIGKTLGYTKDFNTAEERTIKNGDAFVELMFRKAKAAALLGLYSENIKKAAEEQAKSNEDSGSFILSGTKGKGLKNAKGEDLYQANAQRNRNEAAKPFLEKAQVFKDLILKTNADIEKFADENKLNVFGDSGPGKTKAKKKGFGDEFQVNVKGVDVLKQVEADLRKKAKEFKDRDPVEITLPPIVVPPIANNTDAGDAFADALFKHLKSIQEFNEGLDSLGKQAIEGIGGFFQSFGEAAASGDFSNFGRGLLDALAGFLAELGQLFIKKGVANIAFGTAQQLLPGGQASGAAYITGGIAEIAAGSIISIGSGLLGASGGKDKAGRDRPKSYSRFATGVESFGGGMAWVGEQGPELVNLPTGSGVVPNHRLPSLISNSARSETIIPDITLRGADLVIAFNRQVKLNGRTG